MAFPKTIRFISFDCYGTLINWHDGIFQACKTEAKETGFDLKKEEFMPVFYEIQAEVEAGPYELYAEVLRRAVVRAAKEVGWGLEPSRAGFLPKSVEDWKPYREANSVLSKVAKKYEMGLLTNIDDKLLGFTRRHIKADFDLVVTAQQVRSYKPEFAHYKECQRRIGSKAGWVHVGSGYTADIVPAFRQRIPSIWVNRTGEKPSDPKRKPDKVIKDLNGLVSILKL